MQMVEVKPGDPYSVLTEHTLHLFDILNSCMFIFHVQKLCTLFSSAEQYLVSQDDSA